MLAGSNPAENDKFLRATKVRSTTSFGVNVKPAAPCRKILWNVKDPYCMEDILVDNIRGYFSSSFSCFANKCLCWLLPDSSGR
jgi:hypothetical protein